jgi:hypothetical protein
MLKLISSTVGEASARRRGSRGMLKLILSTVFSLKLVAGEASARRRGSRGIRRSRARRRRRTLHPASGLHLGRPAWLRFARGSGEKEKGVGQGGGLGSWPWVAGSFAAAGSSASPAAAADAAVPREARPSSPFPPSPIDPRLIGKLPSSPFPPSRTSSFHVSQALVAVPAVAD